MTRLEVHETSSKSSETHALAEIVIDYRWINIAQSVARTVRVLEGGSRIGAVSHQTPVEVEMSFFKKIFGGGDKKPKASSEGNQPNMPGMRGSEPLQSAAQVDSTRNNMEAELNADRARRQAKVDAAEAEAKKD